LSNSPGDSIAGPRSTITRIVFSLIVAGGILAASSCSHEHRVLAFTAKWCSQCQRDKPAIASAGCRVDFIDVDREPSTADAYHISTVPTYLVFEDGREVIRTHSWGEVK